MTDRTVREEFKITGDQVMSTIRDAIHQGNVRRLIIKTEEGRTLIEVPLTAGVAVGAAAVLLAPVVAAIGALAALVTKVTLVIEREEAAGEEAQKKAS
jgi:hypothetical protein